MFHSVEHMVEIVNFMDTFILEDLVKLFSLSVRRVLIGGYRYSSGINHSRPDLQINTSLHGSFVRHEVIRFCQGRLYE